MDAPGDDYPRLLAEKAERLADLRGRSPGQKGYKHSLQAYLDADAAAQEILIDRIEDLLRRAVAAGLSSDFPTPPPITAKPAKMKPKRRAK
jgi:hypothetical protein